MIFEILITALLLLILLMIAFYLFFYSGGSKQSESSITLKQDIESLKSNVAMMEAGISSNISTQIDRNQRTISDSVAKQLSESSRLIRNVTQSLSELKATNQQVVGVTDELKTLQNILQNPKQRGVLGEYYLQNLLENVLPPSSYQTQYPFKDGQVVDAIIRLDKGKILPVDSKFSLENYNRLIEETNPENRAVLARKFKEDLKKRIDETSKYIRPAEGTMDFAFMFIPSEAIYYDLLANKVGTSGTNARDLIDYAYQNKKVVIVSPTSFSAYLQTVIQGLRSLQIEEKAKDIQKNVLQLTRHVTVYEDILQRLGKSLSTSVNHYNSAHKELGKIDKDILKITDSNTESPIVNVETISRPELE